MKAKNALGVVLASLPYTLEMDCPVSWSSTQEASLSHDYPFTSESILVSFGQGCGLPREANLVFVE